MSARNGFSSLCVYGKTLEKIYLVRHMHLERRPLIKQFTPAYPLTDASVRKHFRHAPATTEELECKQYLRKFLSSLFVSAGGSFSELFFFNKTKENENNYLVFF